MKKLDKESFNLVKENIEKLKEIFPDIFTEDKIDFEKLKENLGEFVDESDEKYQFTWFGKKKANQLALTPTNATLRPDKNSSKNWDTTKNVYIEGDNLEVLKVLQKAYYKKVKVIYIDPPYNTGQNLIYKNDYTDNLKNYLRFTGQIDEEGNPLTSNPETSGRRHSEWLNMMYPRLKLARNLLRDDGFFITAIDHNELHNLLKICDEIFGEENRIGIVSVIHKPEGRNQEKFFGTSNEFMLVYAKNKEIAKFNNVVINDEIRKTFKYRDEKGLYKLNNYLRLGGGDQNLRLNKPEFWYPIYVSKDLKDITLEQKDDYYEVFPITNSGQERTWKTKKETFLERLKVGEIIAKKDENGKIQIYEKYRENQVIKTHWIDKKYNFINYGTKIVDNLLGGKYFDFPKSLYLIIDILKLTTSKNDLILDFFSGSATTAHAVMELNAEDGGNRKFILVQLPEPTDEKSEAYKAGYKNICEIGKERIRRAGEKIKEDFKDKEWIDNLDIGFKVFKLDSTNIKEWDSNPDNLEKSLLDYEEFIKEGRSEEDLLYEVLLKYGIDLTTPIEEKEIKGKKVYIVGFGSLIIYFDEINIEIAKEIVDLVKNYESDFSVLVLRDDSFVSSKDKVNIVEFFKQINLFDKIITL